MRLRIATWNINSVRLRAPQVARFVAEQDVDVLCLQEIKCREGEFPVSALHEAGFPHLAINGQKGWHGVAIASRLPLERVAPLDLCREGHARCVSAKVAGVEIVNLYIPAGGDTPDRETNRKFDHKLDFYEKLTAEMARRDPQGAAAADGRPQRRARRARRVEPPLHVEDRQPHAGRGRGNGTVEGERRLHRQLRAAVPDPAKLFSWWSYRAEDFRRSNRGLRLDHLWITPGLRAAAFHHGRAAARVHDHVRAWEQPSDHAPASLDLMM